MRAKIKTRPDSPGPRPKSELEQYLELVKKLDSDKAKAFLKLLEEE